MSGGGVTFNSSGAGNTLSVTSNAPGGGGNQSVSISGANTSLTLGTSGGAGNGPMNLTAGNAVSLQTGATLNALSGSQVNTGYLSVSSGTLLLDGIDRTTLQASAINANLVNVQSTFGSDGGLATATFSNGAVGTFTAGGIDLANDSAAGATRILNFLSGTTLNVGNLNLATSGGSTYRLR